MNSASPKTQRSSGTRLFLGGLMSIGVLYLIVLVYHLTVPRSVSAVDSPAFLERCRRICETYGLVPSGRIDEDARDFLEATEQTELRGTLNDILANSEQPVTESQSHPLLNLLAPEFSLLTPDRQRASLAKLREDGPVVVIFYYGYFCSHCVAQLFAVNDDLKYFTEAGASVVAISADAAEETARKYAKYGEFDFVVVSDPNNLLAKEYGVYQPETESQPEDLQHGTFIVDQSGIVKWAYMGYQPFTDNQSLLKTIAALPDAK